VTWAASLTRPGWERNPSASAGNWATSAASEWTAPAPARHRGGRRPSPGHSTPMGRPALPPPPAGRARSAPGRPSRRRWRRGRARSRGPAGATPPPGPGVHPVVFTSASGPEPTRPARVLAWRVSNVTAARLGDDARPWPAPVRSPPGAGRTQRGAEGAGHLGDALA
jgi:hypothetical protein